MGRGSGISFIIRRIIFVGNENIPEQVLRDALVIKDEEPFNQQKLIDSLKNLNDLALFEWIDKDRDVELRQNEIDQHMDITIRVKEKKQR
jgi:outer membrane protein assembly factor BamA